jgi:hypothetical protein
MSLSLRVCFEREKERVSFSWETVQFWICIASVRVWFVWVGNRTIWFVPFNMVYCELVFLERVLPWERGRGCQVSFEWNPDDEFGNTAMWWAGFIQLDEKQQMWTTEELIYRWIVDFAGELHDSCVYYNCCLCWSSCFQSAMSVVSMKLIGLDWYTYMCSLVEVWFKNS